MEAQNITKTRKGKRERKKLDKEIAKKQIAEQERIRELEKEREADPNRKNAETAIKVMKSKDASLGLIQVVRDPAKVEKKQSPKGIKTKELRFKRPITRKGRTKKSSPKSKAAILKLKDVMATPQPVSPRSSLADALSPTEENGHNEMKTGSEIWGSDEKGVEPTQLDVDADFDEIDEGLQKVASLNVSSPRSINSGGAAEANDDEFDFDF